MNTSAVSKLLNVSTSTVQRWVKILGLELDRNELGHYLYSKEDIEILTSFKDQLQTGIPLQTLISKYKTETISKIPQKTDQNNNKILDKLQDLERMLDNKADTVVNYQLLQHRNEIEELKEQVQELNEQIQKLVTQQKETNRTPTEYELHVLSDKQKEHKPKKKKFISAIFGI